MKRRNIYNIQETTLDSITEGTIIDKESSTIRNVCLIRQKSKNNRFYSDRAMKDLRKLAENCKSFCDHGDMFSGPSVTKLLGSFSNIKRKDDALFGDLTILKESVGRELIFDIAENMPHLAGFSIAASGKSAAATTEEGEEIIESIDALRSIDFVGTPATTNGVFEDEEKVIPPEIPAEKILEEKPTDNPGEEQPIKPKSRGGEIEMDRLIEYMSSKIKKLNDLTPEGVERAIIDYVRTQEEKVIEVKAELERVNKDLQKVQDILTESKTETTRIKEELITKSAELDNYKAQEAEKASKENHAKLITKVLAEEKLPMDKAVGPFLDSLMEYRELKNYDAQIVEEKIRKLVKERKTFLSAEVVVDSGGEQIDESAPKIDPEKQKRALIEAIKRKA